MPTDTITRTSKRININGPLQRRPQMQRGKRTKTSFGSTSHRDEQKALTAVFMPVRNEERNIGRNLQVLMEATRENKVSNVVIVIDGSTDNTRQKIGELLGVEIGEKKTVHAGNFTILQHQQSIGKGAAFLNCLHALASKHGFFGNPKAVLVNVDADATDLSAKKISDISEQLRQGNHPMLLGMHFNTEQIGNRNTPVIAPPAWTSFRAISSNALYPFVHGSKLHLNTLPAKFGLEHALNLLVFAQPKKVGEFDDGLKAADTRKRQLLLYPVELGAHVCDVKLTHGPANRPEHTVNGGKPRFDDEGVDNKNHSAKFAELRFAGKSENMHFIENRVWFPREIAHKVLQARDEH